MKLDKFVNIKKMPKKENKKVKRKVVKWDFGEVDDRAYRVVKDIELMAEDNYGVVYPEVFRKGDIIDGSRFSKRFLRLLVKYGVVEVIEDD